MLQDVPIQNESELEFTIFCIENVAQKLGVDGARVYKALAKGDMLGGYIVPKYDVLHTQGKDYIVDELLDVMKRRGIEV